MKDTGKKLTPEQIEAVKLNLKRPVLFRSGGERMGGDETPQQQVHKFGCQI